MARVKRGTMKNKARKSLLAKTKGFRFGQKSKKSMANEAISKAGKHALAHRRKKKGDFRTLWNIKINSMARENGMSYSKFINALKKNDIAINRKMLAELAENYPSVFEEVIKTISKKK